MLEPRRLERAALTPEYKTHSFEFKTCNEFIFCSSFKLLCRTSWILLVNCFNIKNNVYLCTGWYKTYRLKGEKPVEKGIENNKHYSLLDRQPNSFLWVSYMMQRPLYYLLFSGLWWETSYTTLAGKFYCFPSLTLWQILVVITH